jgi:hypothetical protein
MSADEFYRLMRVIGRLEEGQRQNGDKLDELGVVVARTDVRVGKLENWKWYVLGIAAGISATLGVAVTMAFK